MLIISVSQENLGCVQYITNIQWRDFRTFSVDSIKICYRELFKWIFNSISEINRYFGMYPVTSLIRWNRTRPRDCDLAEKVAQSRRRRLFFPSRRFQMYLKVNSIFFLNDNTLHPLSLSRQVHRPVAQGHPRSRTHGNVILKLHRPRKVKVGTLAINCEKR